ncbi:MAG: trigger factor [Thermodesulfobacteriota bacterium]|nr:trigger factor [Thermodesulfobacteriota bacterium]
MQVTIEDKNTVKKILHIEIPEKDVKKELNKAYGDLNKTAAIKGFRKGKVPRKILEAKFAKDVHADLASRLIKDSFAELLEEHKFNIVGGPKVDPPELKPAGSYLFDIEIDIMPEIEVIDFKGVELKKNMYSVSDDEINTQIQIIRKTMAKKETVKEERPVKEDDFVLIDYEGFVDEKPFDATPKIENYVMAIGGEVLPEEFSAKLIGVIPEKELEIEVVYADDYKVEALAGKSVVYKVLLKEIQEEVLPPADDTLAKGLGKYESLEQIKDEIRDNLAKGYERRIDHELSEQVFTDLLEKNQFEVPETIIDSELEGIVAEAEQAYLQNNTSLEEAGLSKETMKVQYRDVAEKQAKRHLLMGKIIEQEKLELTEEELEKSFEEMAAGMNATVDAVKNFFKIDEKHEKQLEYYKHTQLEKKAVRFIIEHGNVVEVDPHADEVDNPGDDADVDSQDDQKA